MRAIDPALCGYPEWKWISPSDVYFIAQSRFDTPPWAACIATHYRRSLRQGGTRSRHSHEFSQQDKRLLLAAADGRCQQCGSTNGLEYDHIIPLALGGNGSLDNGQVLCTACHRHKTLSESTAFGSWRRAVFITGTPRPEDVRPDLEQGIVTEGLRCSEGPYFLWLFASATERDGLSKLIRTPRVKSGSRTYWKFDVNFAASGNARRLLMGWGPIETLNEARTTFRVLLNAHIEAHPS